MLKMFAMGIVVVAALVQRGHGQELVAWEKFEDDRLASQLYCFQRPCPPKPTQVDYTFMPGKLRADFNDFAMWRLIGLDGQQVKPATEMSVRARISASDGPIGLVGVGTDSYYWAANGSPAEGRIDLNAGKLSDPLGSLGDFPDGQEWIIQLNIFADALQAFSWPVNDPQNIVDVVWSKEKIEPGVPVIWGNVQGEYFFHEASVTHGIMGVGGDINRDSDISLADLNGLINAVRNGVQEPRYNFTSDTIVDYADVVAWVHHVAQTSMGDVDLNGQFDSSDLVAVFQAGRYEQEIDASWATGDWTGDQRFSSSDLVAAFQDGGYEQALRLGATRVTAVPEPWGGMLSGWALMALAVKRRPRPSLLG